VELRRLEDLSQDIVTDFAYMKAREEEMRDTNGKFSILARHMHPIKPEDLSLDLGFQFFEYQGFGFGYFANLLQVSN